MIKQDIVKKVQEATGLTLRNAETAVDAVFEQYAQGLFEDGQVFIRGFMTMYVNPKGQRVARNPKTGAPAIVPPRKAIQHRFPEALKKALARS